MRKSTRKDPISIDRIQRLSCGLFRLRKDRCMLLWSTCNASQLSLNFSLTCKLEEMHKRKRESSTDKAPIALDTQRHCLLSSIRLSTMKDHRRRNSPKASIACVLFQSPV